ncbi:MAG TPA: hypothetical protein EYN66_05600 [Myxococcales bacterium]|nr:hypothetical protein [Myxococcales bacterium]
MNYPTDKQPTATITRKATPRMEATTYELFDTGELWTTGEHGYFAGYVSAPEHLDEAIDNHEVEMLCLFEDAKREFLPVPPRPHRPWRLYARPRFEDHAPWKAMDWNAGSFAGNLINATMFSDGEKEKVCTLIRDGRARELRFKWVEIASAL